MKKETATVLENVPAKKKAKIEKLLMDKDSRIKMLKAMEYICRHLNDEYDMDYWLCNGVADGDIELGDLSTDNEDGILDCYIEDDEVFGDIMNTFHLVMKEAEDDGGFWCDNVLSHAQER